MTDINVGQISEALNDKLDRDAGNPADLGKERIVGWSVPDYNTETKIGLLNNGDSYVAPKDGFVLLTAAGNSYCTYTLDSKYVQVTSYSWACCIVYPVAKGTTITKIDGTASNGERLYNAFVPCKGVNQ